MNDCVAQYKKALRKHLTCSHTSKRHLMKQFDRTLSNYLEENPLIDKDSLYSDFGSPADMANTLMLDLSENELSSYQNRKRLQRITATLLLVAFITLTAYIYFIKQKPIIQHDEVTPIETTVISEEE